MKDSKVHAITIDEYLSLLRRQEWLIPQFQRDFVWSPSACAELAESILAARPIGMVTIWEQPDDSDLALEPITLEYGKSESVSFAEGDKRPNRFFAVLDGRQRSQATAVVFGGLRSQIRRSRFCGRFYLDSNELDEFKVVFLHQTDLNRKGWTKEIDAIAHGFFPLASDNSSESAMSQWIRYITHIDRPETYAENVLPEESVRLSRRKLVQDAFDGLQRSRMAVYTVPAVYQLGDICEIFETLNTTGTKVSTVDLIHSWLFADTVGSDSPMLLRDWISEVGERTGAIGWATSTDRPELFVQIAASCYIAQETRQPSRKVSGKAKPITSVKAGDLLGVPTSHWREVRLQSDLLATLIGDFQRVVGNGSGLFPWKATPYPVSAGIYVGLRWRLETEGPQTCKWEVNDLDALYRAFFWRNALSGRYDQGFLTKLGYDLGKLLGILDLRRASGSLEAWLAVAQDKLEFMEKPVPTQEQLHTLLGDGTLAGALPKALTLPMRVRVERDLVDPEVSLRYPEVLADLHHIYPKQWCMDNSHGELREFLAAEVEKDSVNSIANLMPLGRVSNNEWRAKNPATMIEERGLTFEARADTWKAAFIDEECFDLLKRGATGVMSFWERRKTLIAQDLVKRLHVVTSLA